MDFGTVTISLGLWEQILCTIYIAIGLVLAGICFLFGVAGKNNRLSPSSILYWGGGGLSFLLLMHELINTWSIPTTIYAWKKVVLLLPIAVGLLCGVLFVEETPREGWEVGAIGGFTIVYLLWMCVKLFVPELAVQIATIFSPLELLPWFTIILGALLVGAGLIAGILLQRKQHSNA